MTNIIQFPTKKPDSAEASQNAPDSTNVLEAWGMYWSERYGSQNAFYCAVVMSGFLLAIIWQTGHIEFAMLKAVCHFIATR